MRGGKAIFNSADIELFACGIDVRKSQVKQFTGPESMDECHEDEAAVTFGERHVIGGIHQFPDFFLRKIFTCHRYLTLYCV